MTSRVKSAATLRVCLAGCIVWCSTTLFVSATRAAEFDEVVRPLLVGKCVKCHGASQPKGQVSLDSIDSAEKLLARPQLLQQLIDALDANDMPPEGEPPLAPVARAKAIDALKTLLKQSAAAQPRPALKVHRLNRFQYNYAVKDLFRLKLDVFELPEKLMTRRDPYLGAANARMPDVVNVASQALAPAPGLRDVKAFPKDLRAEHGFDNQASQLTLSPLLLDAFLRLSVSIVESPDFTAANVGVWNELFAAPAADADLRPEIERRLSRFLRRAFRGPVEPETIARYQGFVEAKMMQGMPFTDAMKKLASAVLCSPRFLYRTPAATADENQFELASRLSFFLWSSGPDDELLELAARGKLSDGTTLRTTIDRMLADPKVERFLDSFPTQWLQLENVLAATPDPQKSRYFNLDPRNPAALQMLLEPLLTFDQVFIENRSIAELVAPESSYRSDFLRDWYESPLQPSPFDPAAVVAENERLEQRRKLLAATVKSAESELDSLVTPVRERLLEAKKKAESNSPDAAKRAVADLKPYAAWEFNGDLNDAIGDLHLKAHGEISYQDGRVSLDRAYLLSAPLKVDLTAKTLEVWFQLSKLDQRGGGLMGIQGPGDFFDTIVIGERKPLHWISGSNGFARTDDFPDSTPEADVDRPIHLAMVYAPDGTTTLYRNCLPYGQPFRKGSATFPREKSSVIFGLRHLPPGGNRFLTVKLDKARLYDRALTAEEIAASASGSGLFVTEQQLLAEFSELQREQYRSTKQRLAQAKEQLEKVPPAQDPKKAAEDHVRRFEDDLRAKLRATAFRRTPVEDRRYGGVITNAAVLSMTSGPQRTQPIARGSWLIEVIFNDPPPPPPNDVPPLRDGDDSQLTIRERFAAHRENPTCAGCHSRIDPLGFALENFDITGRWRDKYENGKPVDASGSLMKTHAFDGPVAFKSAVLKEKRRFARAFISHLLRYGLSRELVPADLLTVDSIVARSEPEDFRLRTLIREAALSVEISSGRVGKLD